MPTKKPTRRRSDPYAASNHPLAQLRVKAGLTQSELASKLRMKAIAISHIENGTKRFALEPYQYATLLDLLEISPWGLVKQLDTTSKENLY
jgi:transcriptional regulator with XRE-family HTH domain